MYLRWKILIVRKVLCHLPTANTLLPPLLLLVFLLLPLYPNFLLLVFWHLLSLTFYGAVCILRPVSACNSGHGHSYLLPLLRNIHYRHHRLNLSTVKILDSILSADGGSASMSCAVIGFADGGIGFIALR